MTAVTHTGATPSAIVRAALIVPDSTGLASTAARFPGDKEGSIAVTTAAQVNGGGAWSLNLAATAATAANSIDTSATLSEAYWQIVEPTASGNVVWNVYVPRTPATIAVNACQQVTNATPPQLVNTGGLVKNDGGVSPLSIATLYTSVAAPSSSLGANGDWCFGQDGHVYFKAAGAWSSKV